MIKKINLRILIIISLFVALNIIIARFLSIQINVPRVRISFSYITTALCSALLGPFWGAINAALGDILGAMLFPKGAFFIGYTMSEILRGIIYGIFFYKKNLSFKNIFFAVTTVYLIPNLIMLPLWDTLYYKLFLNNTEHTYFYFFFAKLTTYPILYTVQLIVLTIIFKYLKDFIYKNTL